MKKTSRQRSHEHLKRLILRDRNHPSVIGWSAGNETFAIALLNKPTKEVAAVWDDKLVELTLSAKKIDSTRDFITLDGDRDMDGRLPVWSKHFSHGLKLEDLPKDLNKPPDCRRVGRHLLRTPHPALPLYRRTGFLVLRRPQRSPGNRCISECEADGPSIPFLLLTFGSLLVRTGTHEPGYHDFNRLPDMTDGVFAGKLYEEGKPGYQYERVPPYVTTFNPGLDPQLPLYKPLPMFKALQAALKGGTWAPYKEVKHPAKLEMPLPLYKAAYMLGTVRPELLDFLAKVGVSLIDTPPKANLWIIDVENVTAEDLQKLQPVLKKWQKKGRYAACLEFRQ